MSYVYDQRRQAQSPEKEQTERPEEQASLLSRMPVGQAADPPDDGANNLRSAMQTRMTETFGDLSALRAPQSRTAQAPVRQSAVRFAPYAGPVAHALSPAAPAPSAAAPMQARRWGRKHKDKGENKTEGEEKAIPEVAGEQTGTEVAGEQTGTEVAGEQTDTEVAGEQTGTEVADEQTDTEVSGEQTGTEVAGEQTHDLVPSYLQPHQLSKDFFYERGLSNPAYQKVRKHLTKTSLKKSRDAYARFEVDQEHSDYEQWWENLSTAEFEALQRYTKKDSRKDEGKGRFENLGNSTELNSYLRKSKKIQFSPQDKNRLEKQAENMKSAIGKTELKREMTVYRFSSGALFGGATDPAEINAKYKDKIVRDPGFLSTATTEMHSPFKESSKVLHIIRVPAGRGRGAFVAPLSDYPDENEFLLQNNTPMKVLGAYTGQDGDAAGKTVVKLQVCTTDSDDPQKANAEAAQTKKEDSNRADG